MKTVALLVGAVLAAACSKSSSDTTSAAPSSSAPTTTAIVAASAPQPPKPPTGDCATLAQKCKACPPGPVQTACNISVSAGSNYPDVCTNALKNNKNIQDQCK